MIERILDAAVMAVVLMSVIFLLQWIIAIAVAITMGAVDWMKRKRGRS